MKRRKVIGWLLFALGIPFFFIVVAASKEITGNYTLGIFIGFLVMGGGWFLAHPKKKSNDKPSTQKVDTEKEKHKISTTESQEKEYEHNVWEIYRKEWETASREKRVELNKRMLRWQELMKSGLTASQAYIRVMQGESDETPQPIPAEKKTNTKSRPPSALAIVVGTILGVMFITIPSNILNISHFVLLPIGWLLSVFTGRPSGLRAHFITLKLSPIFLVLVVPAIFYFYVWVPLCWTFFTWMVIYYISRRWTGAVQRDRLMEELLREMDATERRIKDFERDK